MPTGSSARRDRLRRILRKGDGNAAVKSLISAGSRGRSRDPKGFADFAQRPSKRASGSSDAMRDVRRAASGRGSENRLLQLLRPSFGLLVVVLIIAGTAFVAVAYTQRDVKARPVQNEDHWHSPYGVWDCDGGGDFLPPFQSDDDPLGIHSHRDGIIHVHPFFERASGRSAVLGHFLDSMNVSVSPEAIILDDGTALVAGVTCDPPDGLPEKCETMSEEDRAADRDCDNVAIIQVRRWEFATSSDEAPEVFTEGFDDLRFLNNGEAWVIARAPRYAEVPPPPSIPYLEYVDPDAFSRTEEEAEE